MKLVRGQTAVVTGGASGIGLAVAQRLTAEGLDIMLADIEPDRLAEAGAQLRQHGTSVATSLVDVSEPDDIERLADETLRSFGAVHLLFNDAGWCSEDDSRS